MKSDGVKALETMIKAGAVVSMTMLNGDYVGFAAKGGYIKKAVMKSIPGVHRKLLEMLQEVGECKHN